MVINFTIIDCETTGKEIENNVWLVNMLNIEIDQTCKLYIVFGFLIFMFCLSILRAVYFLFLMASSNKPTNIKIRQQIILKLLKAQSEEEKKKNSFFFFLILLVMLFKQAGTIVVAILCWRAKNRKKVRKGLMISQTKLIEFKPLTNQLVNQRRKGSSQNSIHSKS